LRNFYPTCPTALVAMIGCTEKHPMRRLQCVVPYVCIYVCMSQMRCASNNPAAVFLRLQSTKSVSPNTACGVKVCIERFLILLLDKHSEHNHERTHTHIVQWVCVGAYVGRQPTLCYRAGIFICRPVDSLDVSDARKGDTLCFQVTHH